MKHISRREFVALTVAGTAVGRIASPFARERDPFSAAITAGDIVERIKKNIGVDWNAESTMDTLKAGEPSAIVTGIVTTSMATLDVLKRAHGAGANLVITAEPTFYARADAREPGAGRGFGGGGRAGAGAAGPGAAGRGAAGRGAPGAAGAARGGGAGRGNGPSGEEIARQSGPTTGASSPMPPAPTLPDSMMPAPAGRGGGGGILGAAPAGPTPPDPVLAGKNKYIDDNKLVIFRLNEHWIARKPDPRAVGLASLMGWTKYKTADEFHYEIPAITMDALASQLKKALGTRGGIRCVGDPTIPVRKVGLLPGYTMIQACVAMLPTVDLVITGEVQEWESATYAQDVAFAGVKKGFISIGRIVNDQPSMQVCADWLKTLVPEVPVKFVSAGDPYWRP
jgi:putative NIF3 family GTP cyclohydrolase 1 type 2